MYIYIYKYIYIYIYIYIPERDMSNQIDSPRTLRRANFWRLPGDLHSVAKQTVFCIAFRVDFRGQNAPKIVEISSFGAVCFTSSVRAANLMISGGPQSWKTLILPSKTRFFMKSTFLVLGHLLVDFPPKIWSEIHGIWVLNVVVFSTVFSKWILLILGSHLGVKKPVIFRKIMTFGRPW